MQEDPCPAPTPAGVLCFGPFRLQRRERLVMNGDQPIELGGRAFDLLATLTERPGEVITKRELIARAWPRTQVEESSLRVQINALRRALGDGHDGRRYIANVPGRGYSFVAPVEPLAGSSATAPFGTTSASRLPHLLAPIFGRDATIAMLAEQLQRRRFVTLAGPGGIGKSTVAVAVAHTHLRLSGQSAWFVDLGSIDLGGSVDAAVTAALGLPESPEPIERMLTDCRGLLVLDNCEHLVDTIADIALRLRHAAPDLLLLATSRQPLRAEGEWIHRLGPLSVPDENTLLDGRIALTHSAVQLFVERASASTDGFHFGDEQATLVAELCRRVDGLPLAIEIIAACVGALGLRGLAACLDDRFLLLAQGQRTASPRHQTLQAALDWSADLLRSVERRLLIQLSRLPAVFTLDAAMSAAAEQGIAQAEALPGLFDLVEKSLVIAEDRCDMMAYRLMHITRAYARESHGLAAVA